jgi:hypothetical protein
VRIPPKWSSQFGAGEVSSAALAISRGWTLVSRDRAPMQQLRLSETIKMMSTGDVIGRLVRRRAVSKNQGDGIFRQVQARAGHRR